MRQNRKTMEKELARHIKERRDQRDGEGRTIISMTVKNDDAFLSEFSQSTTPVISAEVAEFIERSTESIPFKEELTLRIQSDCIDEQEKELYRRAIKEYYIQRYIANEREIRRNHLLTLLMGLFGVAVLAAEILYDYCIGNAIWTEVIDIVAWVLLWEATDIALLETRDLRVKKRRFLSYLDMKIEYIPSEPT